MTTKSRSYGFWLAFSDSGRVRLTIREPDITRDERKMYVQAALPLSLWSTPALRATITVTEDDHEPQFNIDLQAAGDAMREALGVDVDIRVVPPVAAAEEPASE